MDPKWSAVRKGEGTPLECGNRVHGDTTEGIWDYHFTSDPLIRYLRDRRRYRALKELDKRGKLDPATQSVLLVCGAETVSGTLA